VGVEFAAEVLAHIFLGVGYLLLKIGAIGGTGLLAYAVVLGFTPILFGAIGSRVINQESLRRVPAHPGPDCIAGNPPFASPDPRRIIVSPKNALSGCS
jgi:hypothetical protein